MINNHNNPSFTNCLPIVSNHEDQPLTQPSGHVSGLLLTADYRWLNTARYRWAKLQHVQPQVDHIYLWLRTTLFLGFASGTRKKKKKKKHIPYPIGKINNHEQIQEFMVILVASNILKGIVALVVVNC
jgi:hypothetical protein